eukprot:m.947004 g.947004  ORF g.947004 m.947004 type:complete len:182 (+) comp297084_c0_seq1:2-547(+)
MVGNVPVIRCLQVEPLSSCLGAKERRQVSKPLEVLHSIAVGLSRLHTNGYIHRAVCPNHVFFTEAGTAKLGGLEYLSLPGQHQLPADALSPFTAPETADGQACAEGDVYSLALLALWLLGGEQFDCEDANRSARLIEARDQLIDASSEAFYNLLCRCVGQREDRKRLYPQFFRYILEKILA